MSQPLVCMTLTGTTLEENIALVKKYEKFIDLVELRVDYLNEDEQLYVRRFPSLIHQPCILTIRRDIDGGRFTSGEFSRTNLFARALAFANQDRAKNFAYVDFEDDYHIPSIQDAALAFDVKIIRSYYALHNPIYKIKEKCDSMRKTGYEIPKIIFEPKKLSDVTNLFVETKELTQYDHIVCANGLLGFPSRVLASLTNSYLTYTMPEETAEISRKTGQISPVTMSNLYRIKSINEQTQLYGIMGWPAENPLSIEIHNLGYKKQKLNAVYIPVRTQMISEGLEFAQKVGLRGLSVTKPHKQNVLYYVTEQSPVVMQIGSSNSLVRKDDKWVAYNTDTYGFKRSLLEFLGNYRIRYKKVAVIGAGEATKAIVYVLKQLGAKVCIFNRTVNHAKQIAEKYNFKYCALEPACAPILDEYSNLIIQTTSVGMETEETQKEYNDPIYFYNFRGNEMVFDIICRPSTTPLMKRASLAGCRVCNGYHMLEYQAYAQFRLFTGTDFEDNPVIDQKF